MSTEKQVQLDLARLALLSVIEQFERAKGMGLDENAIERIVNEATICKDALTAWGNAGIVVIDDVQLHHLMHQSRAFIRDLIEPFEARAPEVADHYSAEAMQGFYAYRDIVRIIVAEWQEAKKNA